MKWLLLLAPYAVLLAAFAGGIICSYRWGYRDGAQEAFESLAKVDPHLVANVRNAIGHAEGHDDAPWDLLGVSPACRLCSCTEDRACEGGCWWVVDPAGVGDLCSACRPVALRDLAASGANR